MIDISQIPLNSFFDIQIGNLKNIYHPPETPISFEYTMQGSVPRFQMTLFDLTGKNVEPNIFTGEKAENLAYKGKFNFGWTVPDLAYGDTDFQIDHYEKDILDSYSSNITIFGFNTLTPMSSCNQISGTVKESLESFCKTHEYDLEITPDFGTHYMRDCGKQNRKTTELKELIHGKEQNESDASMVQRIIQYARDGNGQSGYRTVFEDGSQNSGKKKLRVLIPLSTTVATYNVQDKDTQVVRWKPIVSVAASIIGAHDIHWNTIQPVSGDNCKITLDQNLMQKEGIIDNTIPVQPLLASVPPKPDPTKLIQVGGAESFDGTGNAVRYRTAGSPSPYAGFNPALNNTVYAITACNKAELTIIGDPKAPRVGQVIEVVMNYPITEFNLNDSQQEDYSSGKWIIEKVRHSIGLSGIYLTNFSLHRYGPKQKEEGK